MEKVLTYTCTVGAVEKGHTKDQTGVNILSSTVYVYVCVCVYRKAYLYKAGVQVFCTNSKRLDQSWHTLCRERERERRTQPWYKAHPKSAYQYQMSMTNRRIVHWVSIKSVLCHLHRCVTSDGLLKQTDSTMASDHSSHTEEFRPEVKLCLNWYCVFTAAWEWAGVSVNRCEAEFPIPEPSCHLSFSAKSQELNEWFPCSLPFFSLAIFHLCFWAPPLTHSIPPLALDFLLKADKWMSHPWESVKEGALLHYLSSFHFQSLLCLEYVR